MFEKISDLLISEGYTRIKSNISYVTLFYKSGISDAKAVQLFNPDERNSITKDQISAYNLKSKQFLLQKGFDAVDVLNIVITPYPQKYTGLISKEVKCWIIDSSTRKLQIYENGPLDFDGLNSKITEAITIRQSIRRESDFKNREADRHSQYPKTSMYLGNSKITLANTIIVAINVLVFMACGIWRNSNNTGYLIEKGSMFVPFIVEGEIYRLFTCMFLHANFSHLIGNMVMLLAIGDNVERAVGWKKYIIIYLGGGLFGSMTSFAYAFTYNPLISSVGASGAIFALVGGLLWIVIIHGGRLENMTTPRIIFLIVYALYNGAVSQNVDNAAHIGGLLGGFILAVLLTRRKKHQ